MLIYLQQDFYVIQDQGGTPNFKDPVLRDVTPVSAGQNTTIRFTSDNAGQWFLHW
jgi:FtsP/CotA-like multicopper oxidase with cupredoxin domain